MDAKLTSSQLIVQHLMQWGSTVQRVEFERDQHITEPDQPADNCFVIESGEVRLYHVIVGTADRLIDIYGPGDWIGSAAALASLPTYGKRAVAVSRSALWSIAAPDLRRVLSQHGDFALQLLSGLARQLQAAWTDDSELLYEDCRLRLIKTLLRYSTSTAATPADDGISLRMTHAELADAIGASRETISLCIAALRHEKIIRTGRNMVTFSPDRLRRLNLSHVKIRRNSATITPDSSHPA